MFIIPLAGISQTTFSGSANLTGNLGNNTTEDTEGTIAISSSLQSVSGGNTSFIKYDNLSNYYGVSLSFGSVAIANRMRAQAGVPFSITINTKRKQFGNQTGPYSGVDKIKIRYGIGQNEQVHRYDVDVQNMPNTVIPDANDKLQTFTINHTFAVGRTEAWIVLEVQEPNAANFTTPYYTTIIIPFVIEGPTLAIVDSLGTTTQPQVPYMVLHKPPGDESEAKILSTQKTCRSFEESYEKDVTNSSRGAVKIGTKGSAGIGVTIDYEIYAEIKGGVSSNDLQIRTNSKETCIEVTNEITTTSLANSNGQATNGDLFIGYGMDMVYGLSRRVNIVGNTIVVDTGLVYAPLTTTIREFVLTEDAILADIVLQQTKVNNLGLSDKDRATAQYQIDAWNDVLVANQNNIANASVKLSGTSPIQVSAGPKVLRSYGTDFTQTASIETKKYLEFTTGFEFKVDIGGSGYTLGHEFTSRNTYGNLSSNSSSGSTVFSYSFEDGDNDSPHGIDVFYVDIYRDPMFGSPVFKLATGTRTSCPYEGGEQRDQPKLEIVGAGTSHTATKNNVTLGTPANFKINLCNTSSDQRTYRLGVTPESITSNLLIQANGATNITSSPTGITVPANSCLYNYDIDVIRPNPSNPVALSNLVIEWYAECEPGIKDSIILNAYWATPPPPVLGALPLENNDRYIFLCQGEQNVTLSTICSNATVPHWYTAEVGGLLLGTGSPFVVSNINPNTRTPYYVSCESDDYVSPRLFFGQLFPSLEPTNNNLNLSGYTQFGYYVANETLEVSAFNINRSFLPTAFRAGKSVTLLPGFETLGERAAFSAEIGGCP